MCGITGFWGMEIGVEALSRSLAAVALRGGRGQAEVFLSQTGPQNQAETAGLEDESERVHSLPNSA
jgi:hypothetical protein